MVKQFGPGKGNQNGKGNLGKRYNVTGGATIVDTTLNTQFCNALQSVSMGGAYSPEAEAQAERLVGISAPVIHDPSALPSNDYDTNADLVAALFGDDDETPYNPEFDPDNC